MKVNIKKLSENAVIPKYATDGDAGMDLIATKLISHGIDSVVYGTDLAFEIPFGYVGLLFPRSSIRKMDLTLANSVGVVDSGYRGEVMFSFKTNWKGKTYAIGDRIGQIMIVPHPQIEFNEVSELSDSVRGTGGHGSTGK